MVAVIVYCVAFTPTVPDAVAALLTTGLTVMVSDAVPAAPTALAAAIVTVDVTAAVVGVPEITPELVFRANPAGNVPALML